IVVDAEVFAGRVRKIFLQLRLGFRKRRHEAVAYGRGFQPVDDPRDDAGLDWAQRDVLDAELAPARPLVFDGAEREDPVVILHAVAGFFVRGHEVIEQVRRDAQNFLFANAVVGELVVKTFGDQPEHLVTLLFAGGVLVGRVGRVDFGTDDFGVGAEVGTTDEYIHGLSIGR